MFRLKNREEINAFIARKRLSEHIPRRVRRISFVRRQNKETTNLTHYALFH